MRNSTFYMMVGLPASGKSTEAQNLGAIVRSSDALRDELLGDVQEQGKNGLIFDLLHSLIKADIYNGSDVVFDATNINSIRRKAFLDELSLLPCRKICIYMKTPYSVCTYRNFNRKRCVPVEAMERMKKKLQEPTMDEGWDEIRIISCKEDNTNGRD